MKTILIALSILFAAGCTGQGEQPGRRERPLIEGPLRYLVVKTSETSREGGGDFTVPVHAKLYRDYLLVTYSPGTEEEHTEVIPATRLWKVEFGTERGSGAKLSQASLPSKTPLAKP